MPQELERDWFCRVYVQADLPFREFVALVATCAGGAGAWNTVRTDALDISVDENDAFDPEQATSAERNRWLFYRYTLEIDPAAEPFLARQYVEAIAALLDSFRSRDVDAVAACEFEEQLPQHTRQANRRAV